MPNWSAILLMWFGRNAEAEPGRPRDLQLVRPVTRCVRPVGVELWGRSSNSSNTPAFPQPDRPRDSSSPANPNEPSIGSRPPRSRTPAHLSNPTPTPLDNRTGLFLRLLMGGGVSTGGPGERMKKGPAPLFVALHAEGLPNHRASGGPRRVNGPRFPDSVTRPLGNSATLANSVI